MTSDIERNSYDVSWLGMDAAPKDGTLVLLRFEQKGWPPYAVGRYKEFYGGSGWAESFSGAALPVPRGWRNIE